MLTNNFYDELKNLVIWLLKDWVPAQMCGGFGFIIELLV